jgi:hypothetical protein
MKLTGPTCTEAMNGAEEAGRRERAEDNAGGIRVERGLGRDDFPWGNATLYDTKKWVWEWVFSEFALFKPIRSTRFELCHEMIPLIFDLTFCDSERAQNTNPTDLLSIEVITTPK